MLSSTRRGIVYPNTNRSDSADVPRDISALVAALEVDVIYGQGTLASRPVSTPGSPGVQGRVFAATDFTPQTLWYDYGTGWFAIGGGLYGSAAGISTLDGALVLGTSLRVSSLANTTDNAHGISFGSSQDTIVYRGAAGVLRVTNQFIPDNLCMGAGADLQSAGAVLSITNSSHRVTSFSAGSNITTISSVVYPSGAFQSGQVLHLVNATGASFTMDSSSNIHTPGGGTITITNGASVFLIYNMATAKWHVITFG